MSAIVPRFLVILRTSNCIVRKKSWSYSGQMQHDQKSRSYFGQYLHCPEHDQESSSYPGHRWHYSGHYWQYSGQFGTIPDKAGTIPDKAGTIPDIIGTISDNIFFPWSYSGHQYALSWTWSKILVIFRTSNCIVPNMTKNPGHMPDIKLHCPKHD